MTADLTAAMELGAAVYAFVAARADEDEAMALAAAGTDGKYAGRPHWSADGGIVTDAGDPDWAVVDLSPCIEDASVGAHIARHDPARALREVAAVRAVLTSYEMSVRMLGIGLSRDKLALLRAQAVIWEDHPDYDPAWRP